MYSYLPTNSLYSDQFAEKHLNIGIFKLSQDADIAVSNLQKEGFNIRKITVIDKNIRSNETDESIHSFLIWKDIFKTRRSNDWLKCISISDSNFNIGRKLMNALLELGITEDRAIKYAVEIEAGKLVVFITGSEENINCLQENFFSYNQPNRIKPMAIPA
jgi:hypothetical protein